MPPDGTNTREEVGVGGGRDIGCCNSEEVARLIRDLFAKAESSLDIIIIADLHGGVGDTNDFAIRHTLKIKKNDAVEGSSSLDIDRESGTGGSFYAQARAYKVDAKYRTERRKAIDFRRFKLS
jgi:hypothetical protein